MPLITNKKGKIREKTSLRTKIRPTIQYDLSARSLYELEYILMHIIFDVPILRLQMLNMDNAKKIRPFFWPRQNNTTLCYLRFFGGSIFTPVLFCLLSLCYFYFRALIFFFNGRTNSEHLSIYISFYDITNTLFCYIHSVRSCCFIRCSPLRSLTLTELNRYRQLKMSLFFWHCFDKIPTYIFHLFALTYIKFVPSTIWFSFTVEVSTHYISRICMSIWWNDCKNFCPNILTSIHSNNKKTILRCQWQIQVDFSYFSKRFSVKSTYKIEFVSKSMNFRNDISKIKSFKSSWNDSASVCCHRCELDGRSSVRKCQKIAHWINFDWRVWPTDWEKLVLLTEFFLFVYLGKFLLNQHLTTRTMGERIAERFTKKRNFTNKIAGTLKL